MKSTVLNLLLFILVFLISCTKELEEEEIRWNPYVSNEIIVFESSENELDSIIISELNFDVISAGPTPELYRQKHLWVYAEKWDSLRNKNLEYKILEISASAPKKPAEIGFLLNFKNAKFAGWGIELSELKKYPVMNVKTKAGDFNDVIKIESVMYYPERKNAVKFLYWSIENGYVKFERKDGFTWELIKKYVP